MQTFPGQFYVNEKTFIPWDPVMFVVVVVLFKVEVEKWNNCDFMIYVA